MSHWAYINGTFDVVVPFYTNNVQRIKDYIYWSIKQLYKNNIKITGSEGPADYFVNVRNYSNMSGTCGEEWDEAIVTITGSLRDRYANEMENDINLFFKRLAHFVRFVNMHVTIHDDENEIKIKHPYYDIEEVYNYDDNPDPNEVYRNKLHRIRLKNKTRFYDSKVLTFEKCVEISEILYEISPKTLECFLNNFDIDRLIDWDFTDFMKDWHRTNKIDQYASDQEISRFNQKLRYPKKPTIDDMISVLQNKCYNDRHNTTVNEREFAENLLHTMYAVKKDKNKMESLKRWDIV